MALTPLAVPSLLELGKECIERALLYCGKKITGEQKSSPQVLVALDATCGNGHDTLFLADTLSALQKQLPVLEYTIVGFDIQHKAIENTRFLLQEHGHTHSICLHALSHENVGEHLAPSFALGVAMYNLGYLPGNNKHITTLALSTLTSLENVKNTLVQGGVISVHAYGGHQGGMAELKAVEAWFTALPYKYWRVAQYSLCNKTLNPEVLFLAQKC